MENRGNTEWGYEEKHSCLFNIPSHGFVVFTTMENQGNTEWDYEKKPFMSIQHSIMVLQHLPLWKVKVAQNGILEKNDNVFSTFHHGFVFTITGI